MAIVRARWNEDVTRSLAQGALRRALAAGATVEEFEVAGSFELPPAVAAIAETGRFDAVVPLGCLIRGETPRSPSDRRFLPERNHSGDSPDAFFSVRACPVGVFSSPSMRITAGADAGCAAACGDAGGGDGAAAVARGTNATTSA